MKHQQGTDLINQLFTTSSLLLLSLHLGAGKSFPESETQFGGKFGIPSIGGPLNLRSSFKIKFKSALDSWSTHPPYAVQGHPQACGAAGRLLRGALQHP